MKKNRKEPPFRLENGKKIYSLLSVINCSPRKLPTQDGSGTTHNSAAAPGSDGNADAGSGTAAAGEGSADNPDEVRVLTRLISMVKVWCWNPFIGPMYVDFGHNDGAAIRQIPVLVNDARRPVPLMWNHTDDVRAKAGRVTDAAWENSSDIPPGANALLVVNRKYDPKAALGLELGELNATSIGIDTDKCRSHPDMEFWTFMELQGKIVDGQEVAWLPLVTTGVQHHALVTDGADPYSGPREEQSMQNAAQAASAYTQSEGARGMELAQLIALASAWCSAMGIEVSLAAGAAIPETLEKRGADIIKALMNTQSQYNEMAHKLQSIGASLLKEGETAISATEVLNRLPQRLEFAKLGDAFLTHQQQAAVKTWDAANVDPTKPELSEAQKLLRAGIENSTDLKFLEASIAENSRLAKERFGQGSTNRVSQGHEPPAGQNPAISKTTEELLNAARMNRVMPRKAEGGKE